MKKNEIKKRNNAKKKYKIEQPQWILREIKLKNGEYRLGPNNEYFLSEKALTHIIDGEFSERLIEEEGRRTKQLETILKGGLHTYQGWINFKNTRQDIVHLRYFNSNKHKYWYFARSLQNGVITLKIPKQLFQSKAANLTKFPEIYYKSGYLWKTLFPKEKTRSDILSIIDEALFKLNREESQSGILIGYALLDHPFTAMKIRIQCIGYQINSAFPTWDQPLIGNTGKAYSHTDTINFTFALSTEYFDDYTENIESSIYDYKLGVDSLIVNTLQFLLKRPMLPKIGQANYWNSIRKKDLLDIAKSFKEDEILFLKKYLEDSFICKEGYNYQVNAYEKIYEHMNSDNELFNAISIHLNIVESLLIIGNYDEIHKTLHLIDSISHILLNKITYTGALDSWNNKILHNKILDLILSYHDTSIIPIYINSLSRSPIRNSLYVEFDIGHICYKKELDLLNDDETTLFVVTNLQGLGMINDYVIQPKCFNDYLLLNLSENYFYFNAEVRNQFIKEIIDSNGPSFKKIIEDCIKISEVEDFTFFQDKFNKLSQKIIGEAIINIDTESLAILVKDFFRIQTAQRMKIFLRDPDFVLYAENYFSYDSAEYKRHTIIKNERRYNVMSLEWFFTDSLKIANYLLDLKLSSQIYKYQQSIWTERPPLQQFIPNYIKYWRNQKDKSWVKTVTLVKSDFKTFKHLKN